MIKMSKVVIYPHSSIEISQNLWGHKARCRLCFQPVSKDRVFKSVTDSVRKKFFELTNIELKSTEKYSKYICKQCFKSLDESSEFQRAMTENQRRLYAFEGEPHSEEVKSETVDMRPIELQEINIEDVLPKVEVFDFVLTKETPEQPEPGKMSRSASPDDFNGFEDDNDASTSVHTHEKAASSKKPGKYSKKNSTIEQLTIALEAVSSGEYTVDEAADHFNVHKTKLNAAIKRDFNLLTDDEELQIKLYVNQRTENGVVTSDQDIATYAQRVLQKRDPKDQMKATELTGTWVASFRNRNSDMNADLNPDAEFSCDICGFTVKGKRNIRMHMSTHETNFTKRRKIRNYSKQDFDAALKDVLEGRKTYYRASADYNIPRATLRNAYLKLSRPTEPSNESFKCSFCEKVYRNEKSRSFHETYIHLTPAGDFLCKKCGKVFSTKLKLKGHNYNSHEKQECRECGQVFDKMTAYKNHQLEHSEEVACHICEKKMKKGFKMTIHLRKHRQRGDKHSNFDSSLLTDDEELQVKLFVNKRTENGVATSDQDIATYAHRVLLKRKLKDRMKVTELTDAWVEEFRKRHSDMNTDVNPDTEFSCDICGFTVKGKKKMRQHVSGHDPSFLLRKKNRNYTKQDFDAALKDALEGRKTYYRALADYNIPRATLRTAYLKLTKPRDDSNESFKCSFCEKVYSNEKSRRIHEIHQHLTPKGEFPCKKCGKVFSTKQKLYCHNYNSHEKLSLECRECGQVFEKQLAFKKHQLEHRDEVACHVCGKLVKEGFKMTIHMRQHGSFHCSYEGCSKEYPTKSSIDYHIKNSHGTNQNIKCPKCSATFPNENRLKVHDSRMHIEAKFFCMVEGCRYKNRLKEYLKLHLKNHKDIDVKYRDGLIASLNNKKKM